MFSVSIMGDVKSYHHHLNFNWSISDVVGKHGRILDVVIFIFNISGKVRYVFVKKTIQWGATI